MRLPASPEMKAVTILLCLAPVVGIADGEVFPFDRDKGRMIVPHELIELTEPQRREIAARHRVTLTLPQREHLISLCPTFPKSINEILPYNWGDCTCLVGHPYAILLPGGASAAVPRDELSSEYRHGARPSSMPKPPSAWSRFWSRLRSHKSS